MIWIKVSKNDAEIIKKYNCGKIKKRNSFNETVNGIDIF